MNKQIIKKPTPCLITKNKKAWYDYHIEQRFEAGLMLEGWEVKSVRAGQVQLRDSYVVFRGGEAWLIGAHFSPLPNIAEYIKIDPQRSRKLLLNKNEIEIFFGAVQKKGLTVVPLDLHWHKNNVKVGIALAKGKKTHDKRETIKRREWEREKHRMLRFHE
ncbi:SsrA-binding protein SmpB [Coxiella endosymbiont of Amblyomma nuttalli]|uniref:SsrA-binding protein SmpB n=1 Tax=Coxiella endosymbiont of Amblyomma nuttalli TaxID=2749996 RepID=UPI001BAAA483|nr:SsrA-binding protein SmpB [Coxiella endosymbiont of Amblyomma nuttalli]QTS83978.1 SsrA-binding protein [Coxiella endosymbiont of Amblyomma nuttalli]